MIGHSVVSICWNNNLRTLTSRRRRRRRGFSLLQSESDDEDDARISLKRSLTSL